MEESTAGWHAQNQLLSVLPPFSIYNCSWVMRALRRSIKWVLIGQLRTTKATHNYKYKILAQNQGTKGRVRVLSSHEKTVDGTCLLYPTAPQVWLLVIYKRLNASLSFHNQSHVSISLLVLSGTGVFTRVQWCTWRDPCTFKITCRIWYELMCIFLRKCPLFSSVLKGSVNLRI